MSQLNVMLLEYEEAHLHWVKKSFTGSGNNIMGVNWNAHQDTNFS